MALPGEHEILRSVTFHQSCLIDTNFPAMLVPRDGSRLMVMPPHAIVFWLT